MPLLIWRKPSSMFLKRQGVKQCQWVIETQCVKAPEISEEVTQRILKIWHSHGTEDCILSKFYLLRFLLFWRKIHSWEQKQGLQIRLYNLICRGWHACEARRKTRRVIGDCETPRRTTQESDHGWQGRDHGHPSGSQSPQTRPRNSAQKPNTSEPVNLQRSQPMKS